MCLNRVDARYYLYLSHVCKSYDQANVEINTQIIIMVIIAPKQISKATTTIISIKLMFARNLFACSRPNPTRAKSSEHV